MKLLYRVFLPFFAGVFLFANTALADCCNAGFTNTYLSQSGIYKLFRFQMNDSLAADIQSVEWAFGDGTYSNEKSPVHVYSYAGNYAVTLTVFKQVINGVQKSCSETHELIIENKCSDFVYSKSNRNVSFSQAASFPIDSVWAQSRTFFWIFGDGQTSNELNPTHTYASAGTYNVCLYQHQKDSASVDSCSSCKVVVIRDSLPPVVCNASFTYQVTGQHVSVHAADSLNPSYWWVLRDTAKQYGNRADYTITSNDGITICHRQYTGILQDSVSRYCESCRTIYSSIPTDTTLEQCHSDFTYAMLGDSLVSLHSIDSAYISQWWININGAMHGERYYGADTIMYLPSNGEVSVCHLQYNTNAARNDSCIVCKVVRSAPDTVIVAPTPVCYSDFSYTLSGSTVSVSIDSISYGIHLWKFGNEAVRYDTSNTSYTFTTPGPKRICQTTIQTNHSTNITDSCTICKDILIESAQVSIHPNPAVHHVNFKVKEGSLSSIALYNSNGILVKHVTDLNADKYMMNVNDLTSGMYYASVTLTDGRINRSTIIVQ